MLDVKLQDLLKEEKKLYLGDEIREKQMKKSHHKRYIIWRYLYYFRLCQYWKIVRQEGKGRWIERHLAKLRYRYYDKKRNQYSEKAGVEIGIESQIGHNCDIWHSGIVINGVIGDNCVFHGNNIIGNKGKGSEQEYPVLGDRVDVGAAAVIIGQVTIADECVIGAGAVVTKSFKENGAVIAGVPGKIINNRSI